MRLTHVTVVLPAYNEAETIKTLLDQIFWTLEDEGIPHDIIVVDDGSSDGTAEVVRALQRPRLEILQHPVNQGLGNAIRSGLLRAATMGGDRGVIVTMDADNTHVPGLIVRMLRSVAEGFDVVIASRYVTGARIVGVPMRRRILSWGAGLLFRLRYPIPGIRDYTSGYRAYRATVLAEAFAEHGTSLISSSGFSAMVELLLRLRHRDLLMTEVPILLRYDHKAGFSKMPIWRNVHDLLCMLAYPPR